MIRAEHLTKWFGPPDSRTISVDDVSLEINSGEMLYVVGPSGSGKTTFLSMVSGILRPNEGKIFIKDRNIWDMTDDELCRFRLYSIGFVFQDFHLFPKLTSQENVAIPLILQKKSWDEALEKASEALKIVGLEKRIFLEPYRLSIGEQQRVAIARAIITEPDLLILDEPTASLDGETGKRIMKFIKERLLNANRAILIVTHDNRIYEYASRMIKMEDGKKVSESVNQGGWL